MLENKTLNNTTEDFDITGIDDFETSAVTYAVWAIGYNAESQVTDVDMLLGEFADPDQAVAKAKTVTLADIVHQAGAEVVGAGICIEKAFQPGGARIRKAGVNLHSLAILDLDSDGNLIFVEK